MDPTIALFSNLITVSPNNTFTATVGKDKHICHRKVSTILLTLILDWLIITVYELMFLSLYIYPYCHTLTNYSLADTMYKMILLLL